MHLRERLNIADLNRLNLTIRLRTMSDVRDKSRQFFRMNMIIIDVLPLAME